jgi:multiple sugar transport system permease protein
MRRPGASSLLLHAALITTSLISLTPLGWMAAAAFMQPGEANALPPHLLPHDPTLQNFVALFTRLDMARAFLNSAVITVLATVLSVFVNAMAGYAFAKLPFPGRDRLFKRLASALVVPAQVGMLPLFLLLRELGLVNTYAGVLVPYLASIFGIFLVRQYALGVSDDLLDAARVDGAGEFRHLRGRSCCRSIRPGPRDPRRAFTFLSAWNDFMWPLIVLSDDTWRYTLPVALANLVGEHVQDTELMMARLGADGAAGASSPSSSCSATTSRASWPGA